jgi:hypothetical protein
VPWPPARSSHASYVATKRLREVFKANIVGVPQIRDVLPELLLNGFQESDFGCGCYENLSGTILVDFFRPRSS